MPRDAKRKAQRNYGTRVRIKKTIGTLQMYTDIKNSPGWRIASMSGTIKMGRSFSSHMQWLMGSVHGGAVRKLRKRLERRLESVGEKPYMLL